MNSKNNQSEINIGVDTGKHQLDIYIRPLDIYFSVTNDEKGIKESIKIIKQHKPTRIIIEATGTRTCVHYGVLSEQVTFCDCQPCAC